MSCPIKHFLAERTLVSWHRSCLQVCRAACCAQCSTCECVSVTGHVVGGLTGIFLGWGIGPTLIASPEAAQESNNTNLAQQNPWQRANLSRDEAAEQKIKLERKADPLDGIRHVSISATLMAGLVGIVVTTVAQRVGHIPAPHGLGLSL